MFVLKAVFYTGKNNQGIQLFYAWTLENNDFCEHEK
jgi:hypothetical protein